MTIYYLLIHYLLFLSFRAANETTRGGVGLLGTLPCPLKIRLLPTTSAKAYSLLPIISGFEFPELEAALLFFGPFPNDDCRFCAGSSDSMLQAIGRF